MMHKFEMMIRPGAEPDKTRASSSRFNSSGTQPFTVAMTSAIGE
jgi:hypothetical protein